MANDYRWSDRLKTLNGILADLYPTKEESRRVIDLAGLPPSFIKFHDAALINWFNILDEARKRGSIDAIIGVARQDFPDRDDLAKVAMQTDERSTKAAPTASVVSLPKSDRETESFVAPVASPAPADTRPAPAAAHEPSPSNSGGVEQSRQAAAENDVVVLIHGIRDYALWQNTIRSTLEEAGFKVEPTNYGRFNLIKFLLPIWFFRRQAIEDVWKQIRVVAQNNRNRPISIIAHSFGTFVVSHLMEEGFDLEFHRIIFCGSVIPYKFEFEQLQDRFSAPIINEVGTRDIWPAVAESVTTGYGSAGTYGFRRPLVRDRWHNGAGHGYFLKADFCQKFWVPFLRNGEIVSTAEEAESPKVWLQILSIFKLKYILLALLAAALAFAFDLPSRISEAPQVLPSAQIRHQANIPYVQWLQADANGVLVARAFAVQVTVARIASESLSNDSDRRKVASLNGALTEKLITLYRCAFFEKDCQSWKDATAEYSSALFDFALAALPVDAAAELQKNMRPSDRSDNLLRVLDLLVNLGESGGERGSKIEALYESAIDFEVQMWVATPAIDTRPAPQKVSETNVAAIDVPAGPRINSQAHLLQCDLLSN
jgi:hypothetical protein